MVAVPQDHAPVVATLATLAVGVALTAGGGAQERPHQAEVLVLDLDDPQVVLRDTLAMDLALPISQKKAYTAMTFNSPTSGLEGRFPGSYSVPKLDSLIISAGGLPITGAGNIIGGIGVSGAPSGVQDEKCAQAGIDAIKFELESF
jgi:uncharacterized protein GlcG (DUF336 family)